MSVIYAKAVECVSSTDTHLGDFLTLRVPLLPVSLAIDDRFMVE